MRDKMNYRQVKEMGKVLREIVLYRIVIITVIKTAVIKLYL